MNKKEKQNSDSHNEGLTLGNYLSKARESQKMSIEKIAGQTRISGTILSNIENNKIDQLPQKIYVRGFVKTYSKILGVSVEKSLELLDHLYMEDLKEESSKENVILKHHATISSSKNTILLIIVFIIFAAFYLLRSGNESKDEQAETTEVTPKSTPVSVPTNISLKKTDPILTQAIKGVQNLDIIQIDNKITKKNKVTKVITEVKKEIVKEEKKIEKKEEKKEEKKKLFTTAPTILYKVTTGNDEDHYNAIPEIHRAIIDEDQHVLIKATSGDTWLTHKVDDKDIKKFILKEGQSIFLKGETIRVFLGNLYATNIYLNNKLLKISSKSGVKSLIFPQERSKEFKLPLFVYPKTGKAITSKQYLENLKED